MAINYKLLERVKKHILEEPRRFHMDYFGTAAENVDPNNEDEVWEAPACGTVACIAGWATGLRGKKKYPDLKAVLRANEDTGIEALGITGDQAQDLFYTDNWPYGLGNDYEDALQDHDYNLAAEIAVERIDLFIVSRGCR